MKPTQVILTHNPMTSRLIMTDLSGSDYKSSDYCSHYYFLVAIAVVATFFSHSKIEIVAILKTVAQEKVATFLGDRL